MMGRNSGWKWAALCAVLMAAGPAGEENLMPEGGFESGELRPLIYWRSGQNVAPQTDEAFEGQWALKLGRGAQGDCVTRNIPIEGGRKYRLSFVAKVEGPGVLATDAPGALQRLRHTQGLAGWRVEFLNSAAPDEKPSRHIPQFFTKIIHDSWTAYREDFYAPLDADRIKIVFSNGSDENQVLIDQMDLVALEGGPLNVNPEVAFGPFNFSGYNYMHQVRIVPKEEGDAGGEDGYIDASEGWVIGDPIPVTGGQRYRVRYSARLAADRGRSTLRMNYYDAAMEALGSARGASALRVRSEDWAEQVYEFVPPAEVRFVRLVFGGGDFDWFRLEEADEE